MNRLFYKENRISRVIAIILALIMMAAPFFAHAGLKEDSKAEEGSGEQKVEYEVDMTIADIFGSIVYNEGTGDIDIKDASNNAIIVQTKSYNLDADLVKLYIKVVPFELSKTISVSSPSTGYTATLGGKLYYNTNLSDEVYNEWVTGTRIPVEKGNDVYFYIKPEIKNSSDMVQNSKYVWVATAHFVDEDIENITAPCFKSDGNEIEENKHYTSAELSSGISGSYSDVTVQIGYYKEDAFESLGDGSSVSDSGKYTPCVRFLLNDAENNADKTLLKEIRGTTVNIDADAPKVKLELVEYKTTDNLPTNNPTIMLSSNEETVFVKKTSDDYYYKLKITGDDSSTGESGISKIEVGTEETTDTSYEFAFVQGTTYTYSVYDGALTSGNVTTKNIKINYDGTGPAVDNVKAEVDVSGTLTLIQGSTDFYKGAVTFSATVTDDGGSGVKEVCLCYKKKNTEDNPTEVTIQSGSGSTYSTEIENLSGEYEFWFKAIDEVGNETATSIETIKVDNTAPAVNSDGSLYEVKYEFRNMYYDWNTNSWQWGYWVNWDPVDAKRWLNTGGMDKGWIEYRVAIMVSDKDSGLNLNRTVSGKLNAGNIVDVGDRWTEDQNTSGNANTEGHILYYKFAKEDNDNGVVIRLVDNAGNVSDCIIWATPAATETNIRFEENTLKIYEKDNAISGAIDLTNFTDESLDIDINKSYMIEITASSGYEITGATLTAKGSDGLPLPEITGVIDERSTNEFGRRIVRVTYEVPGAQILDVKNELLNAVTLSVKDNRYEGQTTAPDDHNTAIKTLGQIRYDMSKPYLSATYENKWYSSLDLEYTISSLPYLTDVESGLSWYKYTITNSKNDSNKEKTDATGQTLTGTIDVPESVDITGTTITFDAEDKAGNGIVSDDGKNVIIVKVDKTKPTVSNVTVNGSTDHSVPYKNQPVIDANVSDNLTLDKVVYEVTYPDNVTRTYTKTINREQKELSDTAAYTIEKVNGEVLDGSYTAKIQAYDKAGNPSTASYVTFKIDNTKPVVSVKVIEGTQSPKNSYYYKDNVSLEFTYTDSMMPSSSVIIKDNEGQISGLTWEAVAGTPDKYRAVMTISSSGGHDITINATDNAGNVATEGRTSFSIDKTIPGITAYINGTSVYNGNNLMLTGNTTVSFEVSDIVRDPDDNYVQIQRSIPDQPMSNPSYLNTSNTIFSLTEEADYVINFYSVDKANNPSDIKTVRFRIDKTAPELAINGIGATSTSATNVTFTMREAFWWDANATVTIYRKAGDGTKEELYKTLTFRPTAYQTSMSELLTETGVYRFEFEASDNAGHRSTRSQTLTIDRSAPVVNLTGVTDYDMTDSAVEFYIEISDDFYLSKKVSISGTRTDLYGTSNKLQFGNISQSTNPTRISQTFDQDGIYDITLVTSDLVGNEQVKNIHFVIDSQAPVIADLSKYDGKIFTSFSWDDDLDDLVSDLTVCDIQMYLNGSEYDGESDIPDGSYVLRIVATDEMGHTAEKEARFELDTKAPVFIITGVEDGEVKNENYVINISLQLDEDILESVTLNGTKISISNNTATVNVTEKGEYTLVLKAVDAAGNVSEQTLTFTYGEHKKSMWWIWPIVVGSFGVGGIVIFMLKKRRNL